MILKYHIIRTDTADEGLRKIILYVAANFGNKVAVSGCFGSIDTANAQETTIDYDSYVQKIYSKEEGLISGR